MSEYPGWTPDAFKSDDIKKASSANEEIAFKWVYKVLLT